MVRDRRGLHCLVIFVRESHIVALAFAVGVTVDTFDLVVECFRHPVGRVCIAVIVPGEGEWVILVLYRMSRSP